MHKKALALLLATSMVMSPMAVLAAETDSAASGKDAETSATVGDDAEIKESLENVLKDVTDDKGSFDADKMEKLMFSLFGPEEDEEGPGFEIDSDEAAESFSQIEDAINQHIAEEYAEDFEAGDETVYSSLIADLRYHDEDDTTHILGYFSMTNYDKDEECPDDLALKNFAGQVELLTLSKNEDGVYEVTDYVTAEEGEGFSDSIESMCETMGMDTDEFYEAIELTALNDLADQYNFMEEHPEYDHIEYMGEMVTLDELGDALNGEFESYLELFALETELLDAEEEAAAEEEIAAEEEAEEEAAEEEAEIEDEKVDFRSLVNAYLAEIRETIGTIDLNEKAANSGDEFSEEGTVFTLVNDILTEVDGIADEAGINLDESLNKALEAVSSLKEADKGELLDLIGTALLSIVADAPEKDIDEDINEELEASNSVVTHIFETLKENKQIKEAVEATGSKLFEVLTEISAKLKTYVKDDGTMDVIENVSEIPFEALEAEIAKVEDYINKQDGPKRAALDLLDLMHGIVDELHYGVHGYSSEDLKEQAESQRPENDLEVMLPVHQYELISSVEVKGRQGVCSEGDYYWVSGSTTLAKYDKDWNLIKINEEPFKGYKLEVNHIADIDVYNNELYIGAEYFMDGVGKNIQIAVYDADTLELKRTFPFEAESGQLECSGIAVNPDTKTVWMCSWVGEESGRHLYKYDLETGKYLGKVHMQMPPQWLQGIAYYDGWFYMTADDGTADDNEPDHLYKTRIEDGATSCIVTLERTFDDVTRQGEIEGLTFDKELNQLLLLYNRGARIVLGMPRGFYEGYDKEISEVFTYQIVD